MKERARNVAVGLTVLVALAMFGGLVLLFTGLPELFQRGRVLRMNFPATADVHKADWVHLAGVRVGKITDIVFRDGDPRKGVQFIARMDDGVRIPANVRPQIYTRGFVGGAYVELVPSGMPRRDPRTGREMDFLPEDFDEALDGRIKGTGLIPDEMLDAVRGLSKLAENLNELIAPAEPASSPATGPAASAPAPTGGGLRESLASMGRALNALEAVLGDAENQANIKQSMANLSLATAKAMDAMDELKSFAREASKTAVEARETVIDARQTVAGASEAIGRFATFAKNADRRVQDLSAKLIDDAEKLSDVLAGIHRVVTKIESGKGSAGKLLNDPKLYQGLVEATRQLGELMKELRGLAEHWKKHGVGVKLK